MDEIEKYLISIVLPINAFRPWLAKCLDSVKTASTNLNVELVAVLNNLSDIENDKVSSLITSTWNQEIKFVTNKSDNLADVLNSGILNAKGDFIARIDDDDLMEPDRLYKQLSYFKNFPKTTLIGSSTIVIDENGSIIRINKYPILNDDINRLLKYGNCFAHSTVMYSRDAAMRVGMYDTNYRFAEDYNLWIKLAKSGQVHNFAKPVGSYRLHKFQTNRQNKHDQMLTLRKIIKEIALSDFKESTSTSRPTNKAHRFNIEPSSNFLRLIIISRQYFAIARLYADGSRKLNRQAMQYLFLSFICNPGEFVQIIKSIRLVSKNERGSK